MFSSVVNLTKSAGPTDTVGRVAEVLFSSAAGASVAITAAVVIAAAVPTGILKTKPLSLGCACCFAIALRKSSAG